MINFFFVIYYQLFILDYPIVRYGKKYKYILKMIPKIIYQTWKSKKRNKTVDVLRESWKVLNNEFMYEYYDDNDILIFIKNNFDERTLKCYNRIKNGSLKADFFRYCILYKRGGLYIDVDIECTQPLRDVFNFEELHVLTATDYCSKNDNDRIYQGFLGGEKGNAVFIKAVEHICDCMDENKFKLDIFNLSGPTMFSTILKDCINTDVNEKENMCLFLKELTAQDKEGRIYKIITHDISNEVLTNIDVTFAISQRKFDRKGNLHYLKNIKKYPRGLYI